MKRVLLATVVLLALSACSPAQDQCVQSEGGALLPIAVAEVEPGQSRLQGFAGAASAGAQGSVGQDTFIVDEKGAFSVDFDASYNDEVTYFLEGVRANTRVKLAGDVCAVQPLFNAGTLPNDIEPFLCGDEEGWLVPDSAENTLVFHGSNSTRVTLFEGEQFAEFNGSGPHSLAILDSLVMVSLFDHGGVALVDPCNERVLDVTRAKEDGRDVLLNVQPALELATAADVDGDGERELQVTQMNPAHPQGLAAIANDIYVAYSNFLQATPNALYGPGYVAHFRIEDQRIVEMGGVELPCQNVQSVSAIDGTIVASCSGVLERVDGVFQSTTPGALFVFDDEGNPLKQIDFGNFAPATPTRVGQEWVVGSLLQKAVALLPIDAVSLEQGQVLTLGEGLDSVFEVTPLVGPLVLAPLFGEDRVVVIDTESLEISPWPFEDSIKLADDAALRGPLGIAKNGHDEFAVLMGLSSEVFQLRFDSFLERTP